MTNISAHRGYTRRSILASGTALTVGTGGLIGCAALAPIGEAEVPFSAGRHLPKTKVPANACDCHHHIYDNRFPLAPGVSAAPPNATVADYRRLQRRIGTQRNVVVLPSAYGTDNSCLLDALAQFGDQARGVGVVDTSVTDIELRRLRDRGVQGVRINVPPRIATTIEMVEPLSQRLQVFDMHLQIHMLASDLVRIQEVLLRLRSTLVIDHLGRIPQPDGQKHAASEVVRKLLDRGNSWVKISSVYQDSKTGAPDYADMGELASAYIRHAPERMIWGTDWPHPGVTVLPDDASMLDLLARWTPDEATRLRILVNNPQILYGFPSV